MNSLTRRFEYAADAFACQLDGRVPGAERMGARLATALTALHVENLSTVWVDWLCVAVAAVRSRRRLTPRRFSAYHHSHPTLTERLKAIEEYTARKGASEKKEL